MIVLLCLVFWGGTIISALAEAERSTAGGTDQGSAAKQDMQNAKRAAESSRNALGHGPKIKEQQPRPDKARKGFDNLSVSEAEALARELQQSSGKQDTR
jgi:hypothetical protein